MQGFFGAKPTLEREFGATAMEIPYGGQLITIQNGKSITMWQRCPDGEKPEKIVTHLMYIDEGGRIIPHVEKISVRTVEVYVR